MTWDQLSETYEIIEKLGEGSGGIVYKAWHKRLQKEVVLKKIRSDILSNGFNRREVDILKNLNHTYLPQVLDFLKVDCDIYTVMSYIPGKTFQQLLQENYRFTKEQMIRWAMQLCSALSYLHGQQPPVIHSDIKPSNIILMLNGNICLIDFNIAFFLYDNSMIGYSNGYSSPEQYDAVMKSRDGNRKQIEQHIDEKSDLYSVGATLYHIITGKIYDRKIGVDMDALRQGVGEVYAGIIVKALQIDKEKRYASAYMMYRAFQEIPELEGKRGTKKRRKRWLRLGMIASLAACK